MTRRREKRDLSFIHRTQRTYTCSGKSHPCSRQNNNTHHKRSNILLLLLFPLLGLLSLIWFLIRVIPKPSRATYPCQKVAFPLASGFIVWLMGLAGSIAACRRATRLFARARYVAAGISLLAAVAFIWLTTATDTGSVAAARADDPIVNQPIGEGKGVHPGRVAWIHEANAATWPGDDEVTTPPYWYSDTSTNPLVVNDMMSRALRALAGADSDYAAWDAIFHNFNERMGKGDVGYQPGEKIAIKINFVLTLSASNGNKSASSLDQIDCSPQLAIALLKQLTDVAGVEPGDISIGDPSSYMPNYWYDMVESKCPGVVYLTRSGSNLYGRTPVTYDHSAPFYWSDPVTSRVQGRTQDYIPTQFAQARYFINFAILKSHTQNGITVTAKNLYGALRIPNAGGYYDMHYTRAMETPGMGHYRALVDLVGHPRLGGKTLLCLIDGLYGGRGWDARPVRWKMPPFNDNWPSSIFLSQDPVAIDSVAYDFLRSEWTDYTPGAGEYSNANINGYPQMSGTEDYLHEEALAYNPPSGAVYDPNHDGGLTQSLGVHEHWNNPVDKQYSRNLGTGEGIELVSPSESVTENSPVYNVTQDKRYNYIQYAIIAASPFDRIVVSPGTYNENIDFAGKQLTLSSSDPNDPAIVADTIIKGSGNAVTFADDEDANSVITGFTITNANTGIYCSDTSPTISKCIITGNRQYGIELHGKANPTITYCDISCNQGSAISIPEGTRLSLSMPSIDHCIMASNRLHGIYCDVPLIANCTIAANGRSGVAGKYPRINNSIVYYNSRDTGDVQIESSSPIVTYSDVQGGWTGTGNMSQDPCFAEVGFWDVNGTPEDISDDTWSAGDYHLLSQAGRWIPPHPSGTDPNIQVSGGWMTDEVTSPCIDAGDPNMDCINELWPHGKRINMGAYGRSTQASLSLSDAGDIRDLNNDDTVTWDDVLLLSAKWDCNDAPQKEDLNLDGIVDTNDLEFFGGNWQEDANNTVPQFDAIENREVTAGAPLTFSAAASDTDGDDLVYTAAGLPDGALFAAQQFTWTPEDEGIYNITFIASDNKSLTFTTIQVTVSPAEQNE